MKRDLSGRRRDVLVVLLTLPTGAVDAACFLHLGHVFSSVVTGTMVLLGIAAGSHDANLAIPCGVALVSYTCGVLIGAPIAARSAGQRVAGSAGPRTTWPPSVTAALAAEFCILAAFCVGWELQGGHPGRTAQLVLLALLSVSMGIQAAAVRQLGQMSTTYLTGTLTGIVAVLSTGKKPEGLARSLGVFAALIAGALISATVTAHAPGWLPAVVLLPLVAVLALSVAGAWPVPLRTLRRGR
ncbi:MAG TPA: YoaK family protein [Streptosporangiaceae bacterium]